MHERVAYNNYLKRLLAQAMAAFRQRVARLRLPKQNCARCTTDLYVETYHADLSKPAECMWICRKCRGLMMAHLPVKTPEQRLTELGVAFKTFDEWRSKS